MPASRPCHVGREPRACRDQCINPLVPAGRNGTGSKRLCPAHGDDVASLAINPGSTGMRMVWCCHAGCSPDAVRAALLERGVDPSCLGSYGIPRSGTDRSLIRSRIDPALAADAGRWHAVEELRSHDLPGQLFTMCIQAIRDGGGDLPGDPLRLLPVNQDDFRDLASRAGIERGYAYRLYKKWISS